MYTTNRICQLLKIKYPIIQAGMVWTSGHRLASVCANNGILGVLGAGSMPPDVLQSQLQSLQSQTNGPVAVNLPLIYRQIEEQIDISIDHGIKIFITSAGNPKTYTKKLKSSGAVVLHVVSNPLLAQKCQDAGIDAVIAEGVEAGGHNGRDELTTFSLIPQVCSVVDIPVVAAGGVVNGAGIVAAMALGADGVQMGTRFLMTQESSTHQKVKELFLKANYDSTTLLLKEEIPTRLFKNQLTNQIQKLTSEGNSDKKILEQLEKNLARLGLLDGDVERGKLEIGQAISIIKDLPTAKQVIEKLVLEINEVYKKLKGQMAP